jgi:hypothetical protein
MDFMMHHVAILQGRYIDAILEGTKVVESRLSITRGAPFGRVQPGDFIHFKRTGGPFAALAHVSGVMTFEDLCPADVRTLSRRYGPQIGANAAYWHERKDAKYATFIWLTEVKPSHAVPSLYRPTPGARAAWYVLDQARATRKTA